MVEFAISGENLVSAYHDALRALYYEGEVCDCADWNCKQKELSITIYIDKPLSEPIISKLFIGGPEELEQYRQEMLDGILDFEIQKGNWTYTYHDRMTNFPVGFDKPLDQVQFVIDELKRNPSSRRAVINVRDNRVDAYSDDPACLQTIQFFIRNNKLHCKVLFRSNDACKATFMNAFALIMLQKKIADALEVEVGSYVHRANSFHCYERDFDMLEGYVKRIESSSLEDLTYEYENDWKELMEQACLSIEAKVSELKKH